MSSFSVKRSGSTPDRVAAILLFFNDRLLRKPLQRFPYRRTGHAKQLGEATLGQARPCVETFDGDVFLDAGDELICNLAGHGNPLGESSVWSRPPKQRRALMVLR